MKREQIIRGIGVRETARRLKVTPACVSLWISRGRMPVAQAKRLAVVAQAAGFRCDWWELV